MLREGSRSVLLKHGHSPEEEALDGETEWRPLIEESQVSPAQWDSPDGRLLETNGELSLLSGFEQAEGRQLGIRSNPLIGMQSQEERQN